MTILTNHTILGKSAFYYSCEVRTEYSAKVRHYEVTPKFAKCVSIANDEKGFYFSQRWTCCPLHTIMDCQGWTIQYNGLHGWTSWYSPWRLTTDIRENHSQWWLTTDTSHFPEILHFPYSSLRAFNCVGDWPRQSTERVMTCQAWNNLFINCSMLRVSTRFTCLLASLLYALLSDCSVIGSAF